MYAAIVNERHRDASPVDAGDYVSAAASRSASICICVRYSLPLYGSSWIIRVVAVCACVTTLENVACKCERGYEG